MSRSMSYRSKKRSRRHVSDEDEEDNFEKNSKQVKRLLGLE